MAENERDLLLKTDGGEPQGSPSGGDRTQKLKKLLAGDVAKCIIVLAAIALVAGVLLGLMNWLTYVDPDQAIRDRLAGYYGIGADAVTAYDNGVTEGDSYAAAAYVVETAEGRMYVCRAVGSGAKGGTLELLVHFSEDGIIKDIEVYSQSETAGYMDKVMKANKGKYVGKNVLETGGFDLVKGESSVADDGDVDAVSQATFTSRGVNNAVNAAVVSFKRYYAAEVNV